MPILGIMLPIGLTRVVVAKVRPYVRPADRLAATAADDSSEARNAVLAKPSAIGCPKLMFF